MIDQKHEIIKGMLRLRGTSLSQVARDLDVEATTVTIVSKGFRRSRRIEAALAEALGSKAEIIWPDRYREVAQTGRRKASTARSMFEQTGA